MDAVNELLSSKHEHRAPVDGATPLDELEIDSLGVAELFAIIEDRTGFGLDPGSAGSLVTVGDLAGLRAL